jgi:hypothetical protein
MRAVFRAIRGAFERVRQWVKRIIATVRGWFRR